MKSKKFLTIILVFAMLLSMVSFASASFPDVAGTTAEAAATKLAGLKLLTGYPDGSFRPAANITRAEFSAVVVRALGLEKASEYMKGVDSRFSDVKASHWASGYINIAVSKKILEGYPDGTFKPEANVTYAEAATMLARALGFVDYPGTWPNNYILLALSEGIVEGANFVAGAKATRGDVAIMTSNSLGVDMVTRDKDGIYNTTGKDLLATGLKLEEVKGTVTDVPAKTATAGKVKLTVSGVEGAAVEVLSGQDLNALFGLDVTAYKNSAGKFAYLFVTTPASRIVSGTVKTAPAGDPLKVKVTAGGVDKEYTYAGTYSSFVNYASAAPSVGASVKLVLDADGKVVFVDAFQFTASSKLVTEVKTITTVSPVQQQVAWEGGSLTTLAAGAKVLVNGVAGTFADIKVGDVAYVTVKDGAVTYIAVYNQKVTDVVTNVLIKTGPATFLVLKEAGEIKLGADYTITKDGASANAGELVNVNVTITKDKDGNARVVKGTTSKVIGKVKSVAADSKSLVINQKGTEVSVTVNTGTVPGTIIANDLVVAYLNADGKAIGFTEFTADLDDYGTVRAVDAAKGQLTVDSGTAISVIKIDADATIVSGTSFLAFSGIRVGDTVSAWALNNAAVTVTNAAIYVAVNPGTTTTSAYGKYLGYVQDSVAEKTTIFVDEKGTIKSYETSTYDPAWLSTTANTVVTVTLTNGKASNVAEVTFGQTGFTVVAVDAANGVVTLKKGTPSVFSTITVHASAFVYDKDGNAVGLAGLSADDVIDYSATQVDSKTFFIKIVTP